MDPVSQPPRRLTELDALRGLAILAIALFHYTAKYDGMLGHTPGLWFTCRWGGNFGNDLFLVISGFVIYESVLRAESPLHFAVARVSRLYPVFWVAVAMTFTVTTIWTLPGRQVTLKQALINLTMVHSWLSVPGVDGVYWFLTVMLSFYLLATLVIAFRLQPHVEMAAAIWLVAQLATLAYLKFGGPAFTGLGMWQKHIIIKYSHILIAGIMLAAIHRGRRVNFCVGVLFAAILTAGWRAGVPSAFTLAVVCAIVYCATRKLLAVINVRPLLFLGTISYSLFLIHQNIGYVFIRELEERQVNASVAVLLVLAGAITVASAITFWWEKPAQEFVRAKAKKLLSPRPPSAPQNLPPPARD